MAWIHVDRTNVNNVDIFAFVNLKENIIIKGRVVVGSDLKTKVLVMCSDGKIQGMVDLPQWAYYSLEDKVLRALYEEVGKLTGGDLKNKVWDVNHKNYTPRDYENLLNKLTEIVFETPEAVILKYQPDLTITDDIFEEFQF